MKRSKFYPATYSGNGFPCQEHKLDAVFCVHCSKVVYIECRVCGQLLAYHELYDTHGRCNCDFHKERGDV